MPEQIEARFLQLGSLPLPSAALVVDVRGVQDDDVIERLRIEIADLASEMQAYEINHWRYLTKFLSFRFATPLTAEQIGSIRARKRSPGDQVPASVPADVQLNHQGPTGRIYPAEPTAITAGSFQMNDPDAQAPFDTFRQGIEEFVLEIDRVRLNRIVAFQDLPKSGTVSQIRRDPTVRVVFIADANNAESLASASAYAAEIKDRFRKRERSSQQAFVNITVLCLDSRTEEDAPIRLIEGLSWDGKWDHLDSLIINEQYNEEGALLTGPVQTYLAELILYMLLLIPPLDLSQETLHSGYDQQVSLAPPTDETGQPISGHYVSLPAATFNIGLATIEHSARWGRRWLNYSLATYTIKMLQDKAAEGAQESDEIKTTMTGWLNNWRGRIAAAIPDKVPGNIATLKTIPDAARAAEPPEEVFPDHRLRLKTPEVSLRTVRQHSSRLSSFYPSSTEPLVNSPQTLQSALSSVPMIEQRLREWEDQDPALKKGTPLINAQSEAQNVLGSNLSQSKGAVPRARAQLLALSTAISEFQNTHEQSKLDLPARRKQLEERSETLLGDLQKHADRFPLLASAFSLKAWMAWLTFLLSFVLVTMSVLLGLAWVTHLITSTNVLPAVSPIVLAVVEPRSPLGFLFWVIVVMLILVGVIVFGRGLLSRRRKALRVEFICVMALFLFFVVSLALGFSLNGLAGDPASLDLLLWLSPVPFFGVILLIIALLIISVEAVYFYTWHGRLLEERAEVIRQLNELHMRNVEAVKMYIADSVALQLLVRTGLTNGQGGPGSYYQRIDQLYKQLNELFRRAERQQKLAARRWGSSMNQAQPGLVGSRAKKEGEWLKLRTREEYLDVNSLVDGYKRWQEFLEKDPAQLKHFTELLLRIMGQEVPAQIEQQFREKTPLHNYEQHQARVLLEVLVSIILRFALAPDSIGSLAAIIDRYEHLNNGYIRELPIIGMLIQLLNQQVSQVTMMPLLEEEQRDGIENTEEDRIQLATEAFATWGQVLWDHQDDQLDRCLSHRGVLAKLMSEPEYDPLAVMRQIGVRVALFANSLRVGQHGDAYLLLSPSDQSRRFRQGLNIGSTKIRVTEFPDNERLLLFYIQRYVTNSVFVSDQGKRSVVTSGTGTPALPSGTTSQAADASGSVPSLPAGPTGQPADASSNVQQGA